MNDYYTELQKVVDMPGWKDALKFQNRIYELEERLPKTLKCRKVDAELDAVIDEIRRNLPEDKRYLANRIDDCFTKKLILHEEYFYRRGYADRKLCSIFRRIFKVE